jgi:hypothetical protein
MRVADAAGLGGKGQDSLLASAGNGARPSC